jgi:hypothetical protein
MGTPMQEWLRFQKMTLDHSLQTMSQLQEYMTKQITACIEANPLLPGEGKKLITDWIEAYRRGCDELKSRVDASYAKAEAFFDKKAS